jgi:hypothetical protein
MGSRGRKKHKFICHEQAAVAIALENDRNVSFVVKFCSVVQEKSHRVDRTCAQLLHVPLVNSSANADRVLIAKVTSKNKWWHDGRRDQDLQRCKTQARYIGAQHAAKRRLEMNVPHPVPEVSSISKTCIMPTLA